MFEHAGGDAIPRRFVDIFYGSVLADPVLRPPCGAGKPDHVDHLTAFEVETFGGPERYANELGVPSRSSMCTATWASPTSNANGSSSCTWRRTHVEFGSQVAIENSHARTEDEPHPPREVPKWRWGSE